MNRIKRVVVFGIMICSVLMSSAVDLYVNDNTGLDSNSGLSTSTAKKTIQAAIDIALNGDVIYVAPGVYGSIFVTNHNVDVISMQGVRATVIDANKNGRCVTVGDSVKAKFVGFTIQNGSFEDNGGGVFGGVLDGCIVRNCNAIGFHSGGGAACSTIYNSLFYGNTAQNGGACLDCKISSCTLTVNTAEGYGGACHYCNVTNSVVYANTERFHTLSYVTSFNVFEKDPLFVDVANQDFRLSSNSPCINVGSNEFVCGDADLAGNQRIIGGVLDIGCYEYGVANPKIYPVSGTTFDTSLTVTMTCASEGATIHYTTDGTTPTMESTTYKKFKIYGKTTVKAIAFYEDGTPSEIAVAEYAKGVCEAPSVTPPGGTVFEHSGQVVSLAHDNPEGVLRYTTDGSDPTAESTEYTEPFTIDETTVVKAKVFGDQYFDSSIVTATLTRVWLKVATPEIAAEVQFTGSKQKVKLVCDTEGALIRYTTDGKDPNSHSTKYTKPFYVTDSTTVKAYATKADYTNSDIATLLITKVWGIGDTMGKPDHKFETSGDKGFVRVEDTTATLGESMKSGAITDNEKSILSTTVIGPGTLTFKWKASCEQDDEYEWDHGEFRVDGAPKGWINGVTDWIEVSQRIEGEGEHTVTWTYVKDDVEAAEQDCLWVSDYAWASDYTETQTTEVPVPYSWLLEKSRDAVDEYEIYEKVAKQTAANPKHTVEQCYVAGLNPESPTDDLKAGITIENGIPVVTWDPDLNEDGTKSVRAYSVWGSETLEGGGSWHSPTNALDRFFRVTVEMP